MAIAGGVTVTIGSAELEFGLAELLYVGASALLSPSPVIEISPIPQNPSGATVYGASTAANSSATATSDPQLAVTATVPGQPPSNLTVNNYPVIDIGDIDVIDIGDIDVTEGGEIDGPDPGP
jgi:hypothetical protein